MNRFAVMIIGLVVSLFVISACAQAQPTLIWSDEFDGTSLNTANWEYMIGTGTDYGLPAGWGNNELQYYTSRTQNLYVADGLLHIVARAESYAGADYTSARIRTQNKQEFLYGQLEARIKLPSTKGIWPAFWMMPTDSPYGGWAACGEIDIVESINVATTVYGTIHYGGAWPNNVNSGGSLSNGTNFGNDFHEYAIEWAPDSIRWFVDGVPYHLETSATWYSESAPGNDRAPFDSPFHFLLNVAVGGDWPGYPDGSSQFPQEMVVDWVRVYSLDVEQAPFLGQPHAIPGPIEAENFDFGGEGVAYHDCDSTNSGGAYRPEEAVDIETATEGGYDVGWMCAGEWMEYTVDVLQAGPYRIEARVASQSTGGQFHLEFDGEDQTGEIVVPVTGGWQSWTTVTATADLAAGEQIMRFVNDSTTAEYNLNRFVLTALAREDLNRDGDVDLADFVLFAECLAGPDVSSPPASCPADRFARCDFDTDTNVDLADFAVLQSAFE
ncbi:MAG: family 16 glycosylhydrolase [Phycisphaerae bacterium]|nr:family 16 glycosylhydrolase [Phycisphaerae bacterium]